MTRYQVRRKTAVSLKSVVIKKRDMAAINDSIFYTGSNERRLGLN